MSYNAIIVGGTFDDKAGKPSKLVEAIANKTDWLMINGGNLSVLHSVNLKLYDVIVWMPNIDNAEDKLLPNIKRDYPHCLLVSSKRAIEKTYTEFDVINRMFKTRSNLGIMIEQKDSRYSFKLLDPLGNQYCNTQDITELSSVLLERVNKLSGLTRVPSIQNPFLEELPILPPPSFINLVKEYGQEFSKHINAVNPERFLGNAAMRREGYYLISRRNVDKVNLNPVDFIPVATNEDKVEYLGEVKPSVDSPTQIRLFNFYKEVEYIIHGHVYLDGAHTTKSKIPCGYVEEFNEIKELYPLSTTHNFGINLKGHGCLILAKDMGYLKEQKSKLVSRRFPEE